MHHIALASGVRLHYVVQGTAGTPVILLHGYSDSGFSFSRILPLLPRTWRIYALDLRGHGNSEQPEAGYGMRDLASDVVAFMEALGLDRAVLVGHSMGSFVAQQVALAAPGRLAGLVLLDGATSIRKMQGIDEFEAMVAGLADPVSREFVREFQVSTMHQPVPEAFLEAVIGESMKLPARVWQALLEGMLRTDPAAGDALAQIPALLLWGDRDAIFARAEQSALLASFGAGTLTVYPETGHAPHWERPEDVARDLQAFVARVA